MSESVADVPCFQQSVSFGRFEHDSLCWERWSTFPTNKYLEEVEKCSTPGSVAQKKAYFEAHYKRIAARKAELDQERQREAELGNSEDLMALVCDNSEKELMDEKRDIHNSVRNELLENDPGNFAGELSVVVADVKSGSADIFNCENELSDLPSEMDDFTIETSEHVDESNNGVDIADEVKEVVEIEDDAHTIYDQCEVVDLTSEKSEPVDESNNGVDITVEVKDVAEIEGTEHIGELNDDADIIDEVVKYEVIDHIDETDNGFDMTRGSKTQLQEDDACEDLCLSMTIPEADKPMDLVSVMGKVSSLQGSQGETSAPEKVKGTTAEQESGNFESLPIPKKMEKATLAKKTFNTTKAREKLVSPIPKRSTASMRKSLPSATPKSLKPELTKTAKSAQRPLDKNENVVTPLSSKKRTGYESKRVLPTSLHMSLSFGPANTDPASVTTRKSLIMESMGDKDIVKRAFKAFQNVTHVSQPRVAQSPSTNQSASQKSGQKDSPADTLKKKNEGIGRPAKTASPRIGQPGTRKTSMSLGLTRNIGAEHRQVKSVAASFGPPVQLHGNNTKAASRKLEIKPKTNVSEGTHCEPKVKVEKAAQIKKPSQISTSKPKLSASYNQGRGFFKNN